MLFKENSSFRTLAGITPLVYIAQLHLCRRSHVADDITDILPLQFLLVIEIGRPSKHSCVGTTQSNGFIEQSIISGCKEIPVDNRRTGFTLSKFPVTTGTKEMIAQGSLFQIGFRQINGPA